MGPAGFVEALDVSAKRSPRLRDAGIGPEVNLLVCDGPPEPLHQHIVPPGPLAIHAERDLVTFQQLREGLARELRPLIRVEDFRLAVTGQRLLDNFDEKSVSSVIESFQARTFRLNQSMTAASLGKAARHGDIGDVHCPDLIGSVPATQKLLARLGMTQDQMDVSN
jgi:hypothetical protein